MYTGYRPLFVTTSNKNLISPKVVGLKVLDINLLKLQEWNGTSWVDLFDISGSSSGTVTSVGISTLNGLTASGSPITTSGTISLGLGNITPTSVNASGTVIGSNLSGTNTGDQTITLTGDVTGSGTGSFSATVANDAVTYAKMQNVSAASKLIGRGDSGAGDPQEINLGTNLSMSGNTLNATSGSASISQTEIDFGITPVADGEFIIIDAGVSGTSKIMAQVAWETPTDKDIDEIEMDNLQIRCQPGSGQFTMFVNSDDGSYLADKFKINYFVG